MFDIGVDMVEISRIKKSMQRDRFLFHFFGDEELEMLKGKKFSAKSVAANFCAKEAFVKACNFKVDHFRFKDVQILRDNNGKPYFLFSERLKKIIDEAKIDFCVSITHTKLNACAVVQSYRKDK